MLSTLDPLGMPIATEVVAGNGADDPLYVPAIDRVRNTLSDRGHLYIGDCKMAAIATRAHLAAGNDYYLCPLSKTQLSLEELENYLKPVWDEKQKLTAIDYDYANNETKQIAIGYETTRTCTTSISEKEYSWSERLLIVRSIAAASSAEQSLKTRLLKAEVALTELGKPRRGKKKLQTLVDWQEAVEKILLDYRVQGLFDLDYQESIEPRLKRGYRERPTKIVKESHCSLLFCRNQTAIEHKLAMFGWRVYVSNSPEPSLSLAKAVVAYRDEYSIES